MRFYIPGRITTDELPGLFGKIVDVLRITGGTDLFVRPIDIRVLKDHHELDFSRNGELQGSDLRYREGRGWDVFTDGTVEAMPVEFTLHSLPHLHSPPGPRMFPGKEPWSGDDA